MKLVRYRGNYGNHKMYGVVFGNAIVNCNALEPNRIFGSQNIVFEFLEQIRQDVDYATLMRERSVGLVDANIGWMRQILADTPIKAPIAPPSFRDFYAFEAHVRNARKKRGLDMIAEWYDAPVFYFSNTAGIVGPNAPIRKPKETNELDYELEIAVIIGKEGSDIPVHEADSHIAGFTILNDWSARDIQRHEMKVGLGPAKGKDFATSIGPYLVTPDELADRIIDTAQGNRYDLTMTAHVNNVEYSRGNAKEMRWTFAELIAQASKNTTLKVGDLIGSGTVGTGCITEFPEGTYSWLQPGDVVRLEIERLGILENTVIE